MKVSVIVPTLCRSTLALCIEQFNKQDYPDKELILIPDEFESWYWFLEDVWGYERTDELQLVKIIDAAPFHSAYNPTIGKKRNIGCKVASGEIILHMDDDDFYASDWISKSVEALGDHEITGLSSLYFFKPETNLWLYKYPTHERKWVAGATMCYKRSFWEDNPFDESVKYGEDNNFVWKSKDVSPHNYTDGFCSIIHARNTSPKITTDPAWVPQPIEKAKELLGIDYQKYLSLLGTEAAKP